MDKILARWLPDKFAGSMKTWLVFSSTLDANNKQLLDEVEHDIMNYQSRGLCYLPKLKVEADNTDTRV